jgi:type IV pilus assembly protein PilY1
MLVGKMNMLYLAAKYGGFTDTDGNGRPYTDNTCGTANPSPKCAEWDSTGTGLPDNYMFASNPSQVSVGLNRAFSDILRRLSSGTAASILNNSQGSGANLLQAVFYPLKTFESNTQASWIGELQNLWYYIDPYFSLSTVREDTVSDKKLNLIDDYVVNFYFDSTQNQTLVSRQKDTTGNGNFTSIDTVPPDNVNSLWKAGKILQGTSPSSRTIKTVIGGSMIDFTTANAGNSTLQTYLQASGSSEASSIIDYVRGTDYPRSGYSTDPVYRSRTVTYQGTNGVWKLGDIISSTPKIESTISLNAYGSPSPNGYNDVSYNSYVNSYDYGTRGTTFVGGNDGMLHAFKLGVLDVRLSSTAGASKARLIGSNLGSEQWAFIPQNALPYLRYLTDPGYGHVYYVDGTPLVVDASINKVTGCSGNYWDCPKQTTYQKDTSNNLIMGDTGIPLDPTKSPSDSSLSHPGSFVQMPVLDTDKTSWRTIVIGSMGLGGASRDSTDSTCGAGTFTSTCVKTPISGLGYSSYFALNVTNPTSPSFMWEFAGDPTNGHYLGYSTSGPAIVRVGSKTGNGRWFAVFASGPMGPIDTGSKQFIGTSTQDLALFVVDLATGSLVRYIDVTSVPNAFAGSISSGVIDTERGNAGAAGNYQDDAIYIGYTQKDSSAGTWTKGGVLRLLTHEDTNPNNWTYSILINNIGPVTTSVSKLQDRSKQSLWIYFGTGRYFYKSSTQPDDPGSQEALFGVKEPCYSRNTGPPTYSPLGPVNGIDTSCTTTINGTSGLTDQTGSASTSPASTLPANSGGWFINLDCTGTSCSGTPLSDSFMSERVITDPLASTNGTVYFTTFRPTADVCGFGGNTYIWAVKYDTGGVPLQNTMQGMVLVQVSTGAFAEISMASAFGGQANKGYNNRRIANPVQGVPPRAQGLSLLTNPKPIKKILHIQEK